MILTSVQDQAITARMALIVGGTTFDRLFSGVRFDEVDGDVLFVFAKDEETAAEIALKLIDIVKAHHIVGVWSNDIAQNNMHNAIDDYFFDVLRDEKGIELPLDDIDTLEAQIMDIARARFPA